MKLIDVLIDRAASSPLDFPKPGFYVQCTYLYAANQPKAVTYGPFPKEKKHLYIEFVGLLDRMLKKYENCDKSPYSNYLEVEGYSRWFSRFPSDGSPDDDFRASMNLNTEYWPIANCTAQLKSIDGLFYHDGTSFIPYRVLAVYDPRL